MQVKIVGMGSVGIDYLAQVATFPKPDDKLRTETLETQGGGNAGNALTAAARLGLQPAIVSKIGNDSLADTIIHEFKSEGIDTSFLLRPKRKGTPSPFTYIIVDRQGGTRTCIHTPGEAMEPEEMTADLATASLKDARLVYFDGRLTEAACILAQTARSLGLPVLVEAERLRPALNDLLSLADYVVTSTHFPFDWTGESRLGDALLATFNRMPSTVKWMVTTLGRRGAVAIERCEDGRGTLVSVGSSEVDSHALEDVLDDLFIQASRQKDDGRIVCTSRNGISIRSGGYACTEVPICVHAASALQTSQEDAQTAATRAHLAAEKEAAANAHAGSGNSYASFSTAASISGSRPSVCVRVSVMEAAQFVGEGSEVVVDTTGAGDAFIGSLLYGIATEKPLKDALMLGTVVAACKCTALGARPGLPDQRQIHSALL